MHILLTGASGVVGSHTFTYLLSLNHTVHALDILPLPSHLPPLTEPSTFTLLNLNDHKALDSLFSSSSPPIDAVIQLGAISHPLRRDQREIFSNNVVTNYNILRTASDYGVKRIVQASSVNATGLTFTTPERLKFDYLPLDEEVECRPVRSGRGLMECDTELYRHFELINAV